jgi:hypothetical protein
VPAQSKTSFLDDWLSKRKIAKPATPAGKAQKTEIRSQQPPSQPVAPPHKEHEEKVIQPIHDLHEPLIKKNISSEALESQEVDQIANELRKNLALQPSPQESPAHKNVVTPQTAPNKEEGELPKLKPPQPRKQHQDENDTIAIDEDGNLIYRQPKE